jgi:hypothetical protein
MHVTGFNFGQCQTQFSVGQCQTQLSIVSFNFSFLGLLISIPSYRYISLYVSKLRSLERGGVSELRQVQVD